METKTIATKPGANGTASTSRYAWVTLVMCGDSYAPGAIATGQSLLLTRTCADLICMVTPDVSAAARAALSTVWQVVEVPYMEYPTPRRDDVYFGSWI